MKNSYEIGATKEYRKIVTEQDTATFDSGTVHPVYATFALGRDAEWACRLFVLDMKEEHEEGIGTFLEIQHHSPALLNTEVVFTATLQSVNKNEVICSFTAKVGSRVVAVGRTGQKVLKKETLEQLFNLISIA